jgi:EmrB/QacA subfamily drug resistance transporter
MPPPTSLPGLQDAAAAGDPTPASARQGWTLAAMCIGLFMVMLDSTITSNATPTIQRSFDMSITQLQWVNNAYTLVTGAAVILTGRLGDMFGRKRLYTVGMVIFVVASALSGLAPSSSWLIGSRALQGLGAALLAPLSLSIINDAFPASSRGRAIGIWAAVSGLALSIGPLLGGVLTESVSWRAVFFLNVPISVVGLVLTAVGVRESGDPTAGRSVDVPGAVLVSAGIFLVILGAMQGREWGWTSGATLLTLAIGALLLVAFVGVEARVAAPLVNPSLLRNSDLLSSNAVGFLMAFGMFGSLFFLPLYMQNVLHYSPAISGLATLPLTVLLTITSAAAGRIADAIGPRVPIGVGMTVIAAGFALLTGWRRTAATAASSCRTPCWASASGSSCHRSPPPRWGRSRRTSPAPSPGSSTWRARSAGPSGSRSSGWCSQHARRRPPPPCWPGMASNTPRQRRAGWSPSPRTRRRSHATAGPWRRKPPMR